MVYGYIFTHSSQKSISSCQLARDIDVTQKTAWFMLYRISEVAGDNFDNGEFSGIVEIDEIYIGGKKENKYTKDKLKSEKAVVFEMKERESEKLSLFILSQLNIVC